MSDQDTKPLIIKKYVKKSVKQEEEVSRLVKLDVKGTKIMVHARENMKMTQKDLAGKINKPVSVVRDIEKGEEVERSVVEMVEKTLGVKVLGGK
ncbi:Transcription factor MBF1 [Trachipleistophora hominis]|uniref:Transcription factor MBF1 n=1 Tax=Trachipleistophora hominis TaxID=72359 RepID=L7JXY5_TRAHO|nr:Transcription factor MBF1 [Trachipleistophora hominis]